DRRLDQGRSAAAPRLRSRTVHRQHPSRESRRAALPGLHEERHRPAHVLRLHGFPGGAGLMFDELRRRRLVFDEIQKVADAVLYEGYALYPYRASAVKNRSRWQFGVLAPRGWSEAGGGDPWWQETQCLVDLPRPDAAARLLGRCRFLQLRHREESTT